MKNKNQQYIDQGKAGTQVYVPLLLMSQYWLLIFVCQQLNYHICDSRQ